MSLILVTPPGFFFFFFLGGGGLGVSGRLIVNSKGTTIFFDSRVCVWFIIVCLVGVYNC